MILERYVRERISELSRLFIVPTDDILAPEPEQISAFCLEFMRQGTPGFRFLYLFTLISLEAACLLRKGKRLRELDSGEGEEFLQSLYRSRWAPLRALPLLAGLPLFFSHYDREDVQKALGYDVENLRREAALREVTR